MDNKISLKDWLSNPHSDKDYTDLIYGLHLESHKAMQAFNSYIPYFDLGNQASFSKSLSLVQVNWMNAMDVTCSEKVMIPLESRTMAKQLNIDFLSTFAIGLYMGYDYHNGLLNHTFLESNFNQIKDFLPSDDQKYYEDVIINRNYKYYDEYKNELVVSTSGERGHQLVKGGSGRSMEGEPEELMIQNAGFSQTVFLSIAFFSVAMITVSIVMFILR